ncbi:MAG: hypothetical protein IIC01_08405 [Planctomycetes bacterium]|nr:hypothetical protein [Planctomycetota bacterium]
MHDGRGEVVVTGLGPVTAVGVGCDALWTSLATGRSNVTVRNLQVDAACFQELPIASMPSCDEVPGLDKHARSLKEQGWEGYRDLGYALLAMELALTDARLTYDRTDNKIGVIQAFEAPGVECTVSSLFTLLASPAAPTGPPPVYEMLAPRFYNMQPFSYVHVTGKAFGLHGFSTSVHNACSSGAYAVELAAQHIRSGQADIMVVVGGEAFDTAVRLEWFRRLELYAQEGCMRPFDAEPQGFFVGEGAAAIVLESAEHAASRGAEPYARYLGGAFAHQGWKQTIPDVRSARLAGVICDALAIADCTAADVDFIVPHGAATSLSDGYEAYCIEQGIGAQLRTDASDGVVATAFKPYVGHMLAASGIIDTLCALLAMRHRSIPATLHTRPDRVRFPAPLVTTRLDRTVKTLLKLFTGFTGHDAALVFRGL